MSKERVIVGREPFVVECAVDKNIDLNKKVMLIPIEASQYLPSWNFLLCGLSHNPVPRHSSEFCSYYHFDRKVSLFLPGIINYFGFVFLSPHLDRSLAGEAVRSGTRSRSISWVLLRRSRRFWRLSTCKRIREAVWLAKHRSCLLAFRFLYPFSVFRLCLFPDQIIRWKYQLKRNKFEK